MDPAQQLITHRLIEINRAKFSQYVEKEVAPGVLSIMPATNDNGFSRFVKACKIKLATAVAGYSQEEINAAKSIAPFCTEDKASLREIAINNFGNNEEDIAAANTLLDRLAQAESGASQARIAHEEMIAYLLARNVPGIADDTPVENMAAIISEGDTEIIYPAVVIQIFAQWVKRKQDIVFEVGANE